MVELTKEQKEEAVRFDTKNEWGFTHDQLVAICVAMHYLEIGCSVDKAVDRMSKGGVEVPVSINSGELLTKYIAFIFEDCNYHDEAVLAENGRWRGICRLWDIEINSEGFFNKE